jgi:hypothetical protein
MGPRRGELISTDARAEGKAMQQGRPYRYSPLGPQIPDLNEQTQNRGIKLPQRLLGRVCPNRVWETAESQSGRKVMYDKSKRKCSRVFTADRRKQKGYMQRHVTHHWAKQTAVQSPTVAGQ